MPDLELREDENRSADWFDDWLEEADGEAWLSQFDDDPNPYEGTYSEE